MNSREFPVNNKLQTLGCSLYPPQQIRISQGTSYITLNNKNPRKSSEMLPVHPRSYHLLSLCSVQVSEVRRSTRLEKKKLAMAMREKQLGALGMEVGSFMARSGLSDSGGR